MGLLDRFKKKKYEPTVEELVARATARQSFKSSKRGKQTISKWEQQFHWYDGKIARNSFRSKDIMENLKLIRDLNPDASLAIWNFLRLANGGHELEILKLNGLPDKKLTEEINELAKDVGSFYGGGVDQLINVLLLTAFTQGAVALEVELSDNLKDVVDFHPVDPSSLDYMRDDSGELQLIQETFDGDYKVLNQEKVFFFPLDPDVDDPYGRSPILPILQIVFFQVEVLKDLKAVIHHQGYQRFDIKVMEEAIIENMPEHIKHQGPEAVGEYVSSYIDDIRAQMEHLDPDSDFYHTDSVEVGLTGGSVSGGAMDATRVIDIINQQIVSSLKQLPILLGRNEGSTETHSNIQWQIYIKGIQSIQRVVKRMLERAYNLALEVKGYQRRSRITFNEIPVANRQSDAQAEQIETATKITQVQQGWISNDEAANHIVGHDAVSDPIETVVKSINNIGNENDKANNKEIEKSGEDKTEKTDSDDDSRFVTVRSEFESEDIWSDDVSQIADRSAQNLLRFFERQRKAYLKRLREVPDIPTNVLIDIKSIKAINEEERANPTWSFEKWVNENILFDSIDYMNELNQIERDWIEEAVLVAGVASMKGLTDEVDFFIGDYRVITWMKERSLSSSRYIQSTTDERLIRQLWDVVYEEEYELSDLERAISSSFLFAINRAETIARTEVITSGRAGKFYADVQSGVVTGKKWRSAKTENTRGWHREADNQTIPLEEPFLIRNSKGNKERLLFPGDTSLGASPSNTINCLCWYEGVIDG